MTSYLGVVGNAVAGIGVMIQAEQEAQILEANAKSARDDARLAVLAASVRMEDIHREADRFKGTQAAVAAANGVVSTEGSALGLILKTEGEAQRAALREQFSGEVEAAKFISEANIYKRQARNTRITGMIQSIATTLSGANFTHGSGAGPRGGAAGRSAFDTGGESTGFAAQRAGERADYSSYNSADSGGLTGAGI